MIFDERLANDWLKVADSSTLKAEYSWTRNQEVVAIRCAFAGTAVYVVVVILAYNLIYSSLGYDTWDSTQVHHPVVTTRFVMACTVVGIVIEWYFIRLVHSPWIQYEKNPSVVVWFKNAGKFLFNVTGPFGLNYFDTLHDENTSRFTPTTGGLCKLRDY